MILAHVLRDVQGASEETTYNCLLWAHSYAPMSDELNDVLRTSLVRALKHTFEILSCRSGFSDLGVQAHWATISVIMDSSLHGLDFPNSCVSSIFGLAPPLYWIYLSIIGFS